MADRRLYPPTESDIPLHGWKPSNTGDIPIDGKVVIPPWAKFDGTHGTRVRVVAAPTQEDDHG